MIWNSFGLCLEFGVALLEKDMDIPWVTGLKAREYNLNQISLLHLMIRRLFSHRPALLLPGST